MKNLIYFEEQNLTKEINKLCRHFEYYNFMIRNMDTPAFSATNWECFWSYYYHSDYDALTAAHLSTDY